MPDNRMTPVLGKLAPTVVLHDRAIKKVMRYIRVICDSFSENTRKDVYRGEDIAYGQSLAGTYALAYFLDRMHMGNWYITAEPMYVRGRLPVPEPRGVRFTHLTHYFLILTFQNGDRQFQFYCDPIANFYGEATVPQELLREKTPTFGDVLQSYASAKDARLEREEWGEINYSYVPFRARRLYERVLREHKWTIPPEGERPEKI